MDSKHSDFIVKRSDSTAPSEVPSEQPDYSSSENHPLSTSALHDMSEYHSYPEAYSYPILRQGTTGPSEDSAYATQYTPHPNSPWPIPYTSNTGAELHGPIYPPSTSYASSSYTTSYPQHSNPGPSSNWNSLPPSPHNAFNSSQAFPSAYVTSNYPTSELPHDPYHAPHTYPTASSTHSSTPGSIELMLSPYAGTVQLSPYSGTAQLSPHVTPPTTPFSPSSDGDREPSLLLSPTQPQARQLYSHREQLQFFKDALTLPFSPMAGPFIPQTMYKPHTNSDRRRYVEEVELDPPIYFWAENPHECGISLSDALHSRVKRLSQREETVFEGRGPSVSIRLEWPGYRQWSRQIPTKDFRSPPGPITRAKLAKNVAKCVHRFITERQNHPLEDDSDGRWRVGTGPGTDHIRLEDLVLVSIHHVSMGSWQPQLRLSRPLPARQPSL